MNKIVLTIEGERYEVRAFNHPGEGIRGIDLLDFRNKDVTEEFDSYHMTNEPWELLEAAREKGEHEGIVHHLQDDVDEDADQDE